MRESLWAHVFIFLLSSILRILGDSENKITNGDFELQSFTFGMDSMMEVSSSGLNSLMPYWTVMHGGIQILNSLQYYAPGMMNGAMGDFSVHLNYRKGPGVIRTIPLETPRKGAKYIVNFCIADNPDGGPLYKTLRVTILVNDRLSSPAIAPFQVSTPYSQRTTLVWNWTSFSFVGTGEVTMLQFESLTLGAYGPLIDNITVSLVPLIENGSFENITGNLYDQSTNISIPGDQILVAPDSDILSWTVTSGKVRYVNSVWYFPATDASRFFVHLNAESSAGTITSDLFKTTPGNMYKVIFDTAAYPDNTPPVEGNILVSAFSQIGSALLASRTIFLSAREFNVHNVGWTTYELEFKADDTQSFIEFTSQMSNSFNGPFLDNVHVFEIFKLGHYTHVPATFNGGRPPLMPSKFWTTTFTGALALYIIEYFISEIWYLYS